MQGTRRHGAGRWAQAEQALGVQGARGALRQACVGEQASAAGSWARGRRTQWASERGPQWARRHAEQAAAGARGRQALGARGGHGLGVRGARGLSVRAGFGLCTSVHSACFWPGSTRYFS